QKEIGSSQQLGGGIAEPSPSYQQFIHTDVLSSMPTIVAGYNIEQDHLFWFLKGEGYIDDDETLGMLDTWARWTSWFRDQPKGLFWPNSFLKNGEYMHAFITQQSSYMPDRNFEFAESDYDRGIRDKLIAFSRKRLDPSKMHFFSLLYDFLQLTLTTGINNIEE
ncbi:hypothetical protein EWM64_g11001, partial [Hericium alpestre]